MKRLSPGWICYGAAAALFTLGIGLATATHGDVHATILAFLIPPAVACLLAAIIHGINEADL